MRSVQEGRWRRGHVQGGDGGGRHVKREMEEGGMHEEEGGGEKSA